MSDISAIALFCEDIREEKSGTYSLIGIMSDNLAVPDFPGMMPKLAMYIRINMLVSFKPADFNIFITDPSGDRVLANTISRDLVRDTIAKSKKNGNPITGIYSHIIASPFAVAQEGRAIIELEWSGGKILLGSLNFLKDETAPIAPTA